MSSWHAARRPESGDADRVPVASACRAQIPENSKDRGEQSWPSVDGPQSSVGKVSVYDDDATLKGSRYNERREKGRATESRATRKEKGTEQSTGGWLRRR